MEGLRMAEKKDSYREMLDAIFDRPELLDSLPNIAFFDCSKTDWTHLFTPGRVRLIHLINEKNPRSITELARISKRRKENVYRDLKMLSLFDIIELKRKGNEVEPEVRKKIIALNFT